jgi:hypothetical protein
VLDDVLDKEAGPKPKLVAPPAGVVSPTSGSPISGSAIAASMIRHIPQADLDAYINGQLAGPRLDFCRTHLDTCDECRTGLEDLRNFKNSQAGRSLGGSLKRELDRRKRQKQLKAAATVVTVAGVVAAVAAVGWFEVVKPRLHAAAVVASGVAAAPAQNVAQAPVAADAQTRAPAAATMQAGATTQAVAPPVASPTRVTSAVSPAAVAQAASPTRGAPAASPAAVAQAANPTRAATALSPAAVAQAGSSTHAATVTSPTRVATAAGSTQVAQAGSPAAAAAEAAPAGSTTFALLGPFGDEISDDRPEFTWQPLAGTAKYAVILVDEGLRPIAHARVKTASWRPRKPLRRGRTYLWQVTAILHNGTKVIGTGPTSVEARIHVLPPSGAKHSDK